LQPRTRPDSALEAPETPVRVSAPSGRGREALPLAVSAALHAALLLALAYALPLPRFATPPPVESIAVELLSEAEIAALRPPREEAPEAASEPAVVPPPPPPAEPPLVLAHAGTLYSGTALGRQLRRELGTLALDARFEQLCDVEAMEQIARSGDAFRPERAVAYATSDVKVDGNLMIAEGAAFLSEGQWYRLSFRCETTPDHSKVVSFDFATGGVVTEGRGLGDGASD
jgi:hypothetical protein